jgi:hypothetical protein
MRPRWLKDVEWLHHVADNQNALVRVNKAAVENIHRIANRLGKLSLGDER